MVKKHRSRVMTHAVPRDKKLNTLKRTSPRPLPGATMTVLRLITIKTRISLQQDSEQTAGLSKWKTLPKKRV